MMGDSVQLADCVLQPDNGNLDTSLSGRPMQVVAWQFNNWRVLR